MATSITHIPATRSRYSSNATTTSKTRKVAGYARVSTDLDEQATSFGAQLEYYTNYIKSHKGWSFVDVYSDEGITGTSTEGRAGFKKMIADALDGKIDLILTKSVSRFARNTVDTLTTIRNLKDRGIEVYFEKENIWTFDTKGELMLTIMASIAQEESRSISENIRWSIQKKFEKGRFSLPYKCFLGYDKGEDGMPRINEKEAEVVRAIYQMYLIGDSPVSIARALEAKEIKAPRGGNKWSETTITSILTNEKYCGDAVLQKHFSVDFLSKKQLVNNGEVPKYFVQDSHEAIISKEEFNLVKAEMERRRSANKSHCYSTALFAGKVFCGDCGTAYGSKLWHSNDIYRRIIYQCNAKYKNSEKRCTTPHLTEEELKQVCIMAINRYLACRDEVIANLEDIKATLTTTTELERRLNQIDTELEVKCQIYDRALLQGPITDPSALEELQKSCEQLQKQKDEVLGEISRTKSVRANFNRIIRSLKDSGPMVTEFSKPLFSVLIDSISVYSKQNIKVRFNCSKEIVVALPNKKAECKEKAV